MGGVRDEASPGSPHQQRPTRAGTAVRTKRLGGAGVEGHESVTVEVTSHDEDEPRAVEVLDLESERLAAAQPGDIEQGDQDVHRFGQAARGQAQGSGHELGDLGRRVQAGVDPLVAAADQALGIASAAAGPMPSATWRMP